MSEEKITEKQDLWVGILLVLGLSGIITALDNPVLGFIFTSTSVVVGSLAMIAEVKKEISEALPTFEQGVKQRGVVLSWGAITLLSFFAVLANKMFVVIGVLTIAYSILKAVRNGALQGELNDSDVMTFATEFGIGSILVISFSFPQIYLIPVALTFLNFIWELTTKDSKEKFRRVLNK